ncbi:MAG: hypothetical protein J5637_04870 [Prevotella sp.]|nr:hypothetical protein [Prevotella sp.]
MDFVKSCVVLSFFLLAASLSGCVKKEKGTTIPNIDSLVDAKVEQRLKEKAMEDTALSPSQSSVDEGLAVTDDNGLDNKEIEADDTDDYMCMEGTIGPYSITMFLRDLSDVDEGDIIGYYYYNERPHSHFSLEIVRLEPINITGSHKLVLREYTQKGSHTGTFNGQYEARGDYYSGIFTNSKGQRFEFEVL